MTVYYVPEWWAKIRREVQHSILVNNNYLEILMLTQTEVVTMKIVE